MCEKNPRNDDDDRYTIEGIVVGDVSVPQRTHKDISESPYGQRHQDKSRFVGSSFKVHETTTMIY